MLPRIHYILALAMVATLTAATQALVQHALSDAESDNGLINVAGRQRMLSQRIAKCALQLTVGDADAEAVAAELDRSLGELLTSHESLIHGDPTRGLPAAEDPALRARLEQLRGPLDDLAIAARSVMSADRVARALACRQILDIERVFLPEMHAIVGAFEAHGTEKITRLRRLELGLFCATLLVLILELLLVFEPVHRALSRQMRELAAARDAAVEASRAKSVFLATMSHEIRTPLTAILGFGELLDAPQASAAERVECVRAIRRNGAHLQALVHDVLDMAKVESGRLQIEAADVDLRRLVREAVEICGGRARERGNRLSFEIRGTVPELIRSDPLRIRQCLINLISNALEYTQQGSVTVVLSADRVLDRCRVDVIDAGQGIPTERQEAIFEEFEQGAPSTARRHGGSGLGLTLSRSFARALGGDLTLQSQVGRGSTFTLTFAIGRSDVLWVEGEPSMGDAAVDPQAAAYATDLRGMRVLFVDDARDTRRLFAHLLGSRGASVATAADGREGVDRALAERDVGRPFDVVVMDMSMPVLDGYSATRELRAAGYRGPILAMTAHALREEMQECLAAGCDAYLPKPVRGEVVARMLRTLAGARPADAVAAAGCGGALRPV